jgi:hypothetical protein
MTTRLTGRRNVVRLLLAGLAVPLALLASTMPAESTPAAAPSADRATQYKRVMMIVLDQLRPEFIKAFDMRNVQRLMARGTSYPNAYLGHMASETVISHNVMTSGQLPKRMGWSDEWYRDVDGVLGAPGGRYVSGSMAAEQFDAIIEDRGYPKLADYLHRAFPGTKVAAIGEKNYATYSMGGPGADMRITFGSRNADCDGTGVTWRGPTGPGVPDYILGADPIPDNGVVDPSCNKYYVDADRTLDYGTLSTSPARMYPLEGNRDFPGNDRAHQGGDVWVANAAVDVMDHESWSGLLLTFGGVDKAGHMWGGLNDVPPYPGADPAVHMASMARIADQQVGRLMAELRRRGLLDETLVVLTTDHAQLHAKTHFGIDRANQGNFNWYYGTDADETYLDPSPEIAKLIAGTGQNVEMSMQDSAVRTWLLDRSGAAKRRAADVMATLGGVRASYYRVGSRYQLRWRAPRSAFGAREWRWFARHAQEIVNTQAAPYGPDVVGLLADDTSYGVIGDHGGAQESVQRIPIAFRGPGVAAGRRPGTAVRSVDILPTVLRELGIRKTHRMDGHGYRLR